MWVLPPIARCAIPKVQSFFNFILLAWSHHYKGRSTKCAKSGRAKVRVFDLCPIVSRSHGFSQTKTDRIKAVVRISVFFQPGMLQALLLLGSKAPPRAVPLHLQFIHSSNSQSFPSQREYHLGHCTGRPIGVRKMIGGPQQKEKIAKTGHWKKLICLVKSTETCFCFVMNFYEFLTLCGILLPWKELLKMLFEHPSK